MAEVGIVRKDTGTGGLMVCAAIAAFLVVVLTLAEVVAFAVAPQPGTAHEWFRLFTDSPVSGIVGFWGLELPMYAMFVIVFVALHVELGHRAPARAAIALVFTGIGAAIFFATNNPFTMLSLATQYDAAADESGRALFLAAGEAVIANTGQRAVGGFNVGLFFVTIAGLLVSSCMPALPRFGRRLAALGYLAFGFSLLDYVRQFVTSSGIIALFVIMPGALLLMAWFVIVGVRLLVSRRTASPARA